MRSFIGLEEALTIRSDDVSLSHASPPDILLIFLAHRRPRERSRPRKYFFSSPPLLFPSYTSVHKLGAASKSARLKSRLITFYNTRRLSPFRHHTQAGYLSQTSLEEWGSDKETETNGTTTGPREHESDQREENSGMRGGPQGRLRPG